MPDLSLSPVIAANARAIRARLQLRQVDVAQRAGISRTQLGVIEGGGRRITVEDVLALCRGLDVGIRELLAGADGRDVEVLRL